MSNNSSPTTSYETAQATMMQAYDFPETPRQSPSKPPDMTNESALQQQSEALGKNPSVLTKKLLNISKPKGKQAIKHSRRNPVNKSNPAGPRAPTGSAARPGTGPSTLNLHQKKGSLPSEPTKVNQAHLDGLTRLSSNQGTPKSGPAQVEPNILANPTSKLDNKQAVLKGPCGFTKDEDPSSSDLDHASFSPSDYSPYADNLATTNIASIATPTAAHAEQPPTPLTATEQTPTPLTATKQHDRKGFCWWFKACWKITPAGMNSKDSSAASKTSKDKKEAPNAPDVPFTNPQIFDARDLEEERTKRAAAENYNFHLIPESALRDF